MTARETVPDEPFDSGWIWYGLIFRLSDPTMHGIWTRFQLYGTAPHEEPPT